MLRGGKKRAKCSDAAARKNPGTSVRVVTSADVPGAFTGAFSAATKNAPKNESVARCDVWNAGRVAKSDVGGAGGGGGTGCPMLSFNRATHVNVTERSTP